MEKTEREGRKMKTIPDDNEQWLLDGICKKCRRKGFCSIPCKKNKERTECEIMEYIHAKTGIGVLIDELIKRSGK